MAGEISPFVIFFASILTSNMILSNFLGMCSYISISGEYKTASGLGKSVTLVMVFTTVINFAIYHLVIVPLNLQYLQYILFIIIIAATVQIIEMAMDRFLPDLHVKLGIFLPLITVNCAILGTTLFMVIRDYGFVQSLVFGLGSGLGWWLAISALAAIREKMAKTKLPRGLAGPGIAFIITGIMALAFIGFSGIFTIQ
ncbi:MAG: NADH:ubiquinone reductase (Na(+)-transporting) subunit E [Clostridia bacterium]|nr:Rnf-Nqr domain containing protein [Eubacteriales bacterium]MDD3867110.1 Rnf-Nqr domain containing protein [Eubacteriales bacterium]MDD4462397.1 Rnf-Nqr domain containing protein [Eubacteriales bacterium]NCC48925.1 NADH:ubiquinone reductase (Na(+)-transporting) subunit E [Clostridia bacterium]